MPHERRKTAVIAELWTNEIEQWRQGAERDARKVTAGLKLVSRIVPANPEPIVEALHRQFNVLADLEFQNDQAAFTGDTQDVNHPAITAKECGNLRINKTWIELCMDQPNIP